MVADGVNIIPESVRDALEGALIVSPETEQLVRGMAAVAEMLRDGGFFDTKEKA